MQRRDGFAASIAIAVALLITPLLGLVPPGVLTVAVSAGVPRPVTRWAGTGLLAWSIPSYLWLIADDDAKWGRPGVTHWWITSRSFLALALGATIGLAALTVERRNGQTRSTGSATTASSVPGGGS
jgi:hypothetical protein